MENELNNSFSTQENSIYSNSNDCTIPLDSKILEGIIKILHKLINKNKHLSNYQKLILKQDKSIFSQNQIPEISLEKYLNRIKKYTEIENNTLIISLIYIDRLFQESNLILTAFNVHRILFASILLALKYNEDLIYEFYYYSKIAGISAKELSKLENEFVHLIDFNLFVEKNEFITYKEFLLNTIQDY